VIEQLRDSSPPVIEHFVKTICPKIVSGTFLPGLATAGQARVFLLLFVTALPEAVSYTPSNVLKRIVELPEVQSDDFILSSRRVSCLYYRLLNEAKGNSRILILREASRSLAHCNRRVVLFFTQALIACLATWLVRSSVEVFLLTEINRFLSLVFQAHMSVFSVSSVGAAVQ
jgi:hypothetical protein